MTTFATAEAARLRAIEILRAAGLTAEAGRLAALPPVTDRESALDTARAADAAWHAAHAARRESVCTATRSAWFAACNAAYSAVAS